MSHAKQDSMRKRRSKAVPVLGAAGLLSLASGASAQGVGPVGAMLTHTDASHEITLSEEEVSDVSLVRIPMKSAGDSERKRPPEPIEASRALW
jgi:hypothetical protein